MDWIDDEAGQSDIANQGTCTKQDVAVATGVVGVITGGVSVGLEVIGLGAILTFISVVNSIDDIGTDKRGESFLQQMVKSQGAKDKIGLVKIGLNVISSMLNIKTICSKGNSEGKVVKVVDLLNTYIGQYYSIEK